MSGLPKASSVLSRPRALIAASGVAVALSFVFWFGAARLEPNALPSVTPTKTNPATTTVLANVNGPSVEAHRSPEPMPAASARRVALGRKIFFEKGFSEPPGTSCASCHDPARAFSGNNGSTLGAPAGSRPNHFGRRNTPSVL